MVLGEIVGLIFSCVKIANENERENQRQCVRYVQVPQQQVVMVSHHHPRQMCAQKPRTIINQLIQGQISFRDSKCVYRADHATQQHIRLVRSRLSRVVEVISNNNTHRGILVVSNPRGPVKLNQEPLEGFSIESHGSAEEKMATHTL